MCVCVKSSMQYFFVGNIILFQITRGFFGDGLKPQLAGGDGYDIELHGEQTKNGARACVCVRACANTQKQT